MANGETKRTQTNGGSSGSRTDIDFSKAGRDAVLKIRLAMLVGIVIATASAVGFYFDAKQEVSDIQRRLTYLEKKVDGLERTISDRWTRLDMKLYARLARAAGVEFPEVD